MRSFRPWGSRSHLASVVTACHRGTARHAKVAAGPEEHASIAPCGREVLKSIQASGRNAAWPTRQATHWTFLDFMCHNFMLGGHCCG